MKNILKWIPIGVMVIILSLIVPAIWFGATIVPTAISTDILVNDKYTTSVENLNNAYYIDQNKDKIDLNSLAELGDYLEDNSTGAVDADTSVPVYIEDDTLYNWSRLWGSDKTYMYKQALRANLYNLTPDERQDFMAQVKDFTNPQNKATRTIQFFVQTSDREFQKEIMEIKSTGDGTVDRDIDFLNDPTRFKDKYKKARLQLIGLSVAYIIEIIIFLIIFIGILGMFITFFLG